MPENEDAGGETKGQESLGKAKEVERPTIVPNETTEGSVDQEKESNAEEEKERVV